MLTIALHLYPLQLKRNWTIASRLGKGGQGIRQRSIWLLKLRDESGAIGYGEAAPVNTYGETLRGVSEFLRQLDWSRFSFENLPQSLAYLHSHPGNYAARNAVEMALFDGASKRSGKSIASLLGLPPSTADLPPTAFSIGIGSPEETRLAAEASRAFPVIKLKTGPSGLEETLAAFRSVRPEAPIRIDGNEAWTSKEIALAQIELASRYGPVEFIEQPMPRSTSINDLTWLKERSPLPLVADEAFRSLDDLECCEAGFHGINAKLVKHAGISETCSILKAAKACGLKTQLGCMIESSLGIAAALQLAHLADWIDLDGALLVENDPFEGVVEKSGQLQISPNSLSLGLKAQPSRDFWQFIPPLERPIADRATVDFPSEAYGHSVNGIPLEVYLPSSGECDLLIFASIHGEEPETTALLSKALRSLEAPPPRTACVLNANPDGTLLGTRCNARGVELNRNFPSANWRDGTVSTKWAHDHGRVDYSTGAFAGSEPETQALMQLVQQLAPRCIIALHAPLACIEDPEYSPLGYRLARATKLPLVGNIGYETPGSFGSWAKEAGYHVITYELPPISVSAMHGEHLKCFVELLQHGLDRPSAAKAV